MLVSEKSLSLCVSMSRLLPGTMGGVMWRSKANLIDLKNGCDFTSEAPALEPNRFASRLISSCRISDLHWFETACGSFWSFEGGKLISVLIILKKVSFLLYPLKGVVPYYNENLAECLQIHLSRYLPTFHILKSQVSTNPHYLCVLSLGLLPEQCILIKWFN